MREGESKRQLSKIKERRRKSIEQRERERESVKSV